MPDDEAGKSPSGAGGVFESDAEPQDVAIGDCVPDPEAKVEVRELPRLARVGMRIVWAAGRRELLLVLALQVIGGIDLALLLILGRQGLETLLAAVQRGGSLAQVAPSALVIAAIVALNLFVMAIQRERQQLLGELVLRHVQERVLDVTTQVELAAFDTPAFHNRVERIQRYGHHPLGVVWGLTGLAQGVIGVASVVVAFLAVAPASGSA